MEIYFRKKVVLLLLAIGIFACTNDDPSLTKKEKSTEFTTPTIDLNKTSFNNIIPFLKYKDKSELLKKLDHSIELYMTESLELVNSNSNVTDLIVNISFGDNKAIITNKIEYNSRTKRIVSGYYLNNDGTYSKYPPDADNLDIANCPYGFTQIAHCNNAPNGSDCVGEAMQEFYEDNAEAGNCLNIQILTGTFTSKVCGKSGC